MNLFALNAAEVNGSIEVWSWYGNAELTVNGAGEVQLGLTAEGDADIVTSGSLAPRLDIYAPLDAASVNVGASGDLILGLVGGGSAAITVSATGQGTRWVFGESDFQIVVESEGDGQAVAPSAATSGSGRGVLSDSTPPSDTRFRWAMAACSVPDP